jgi:hypothetical protein
MPNPLRIALQAAIAVVLTLGTAHGEDIYAVKDRLAKVKQEYDTAVEKYRSTVTELLEKREEAARKGGNIKALEAVKASRDYYEKEKLAPSDFPKAIVDQVGGARAKLNKAYNDAVRDLIRIKEDEMAAAVDKEQNKFIIDSALAFGRRTFLSSFKAFDVKSSKNSFDGDSSKYKFDGEAIPHSMFLHPTTKSFSNASFPIVGRMMLFRSTVGVPKVPGLAGPPGSALIFELLGDNKSLWKSEPVTKLDKFQTCEVRIDKVKTLTLRVNCTGDEACAHAVWFGPIVIE